MTVYIVGIPYLEIDQARRPGKDMVTRGSQLGDPATTAQPELSFAGLLRQLRTEARLTQEELAEASRLSPRSISDLERGVNLTARKATALLLADALHLPAPVRTLFVAAARGRAPAIEVLMARDRPPSAGPLAAGTSPDDVADLHYRAPGLAQLIAAITAEDAARDGGMHGIYVIRP